MILHLLALSLMCLVCAGARASTRDGACFTTPLGMEDGRITDSRLNASSSYSPEVGPTHARLRTEEGGGAWCPQPKVGTDLQEYIQIDLGRKMLIRGIETQGRFANGMGVEYAEAFAMDYLLGNSGWWMRNKRLMGEELYPANNNTYTVVRNRLTFIPIITRHLRILPYSSTPKRVCIRFELYGCPHDN